MESVDNTDSLSFLSHAIFFFLSLDELDGKLNGSDSAITVCILNFYSNQSVFANVIENLIIIYTV